MVDFDDMIGRTLTSVRLNAKCNRVTFCFEDGFARAFGVEGDCCSNSWIEHLELPRDVAGAKLLSVEDSNRITQDHPEHDEENGGEAVAVYNTRFLTDRGEIVLEYRNSSNGYYGGFLVDAAVPEEAQSPSDEAGR